jgi:Zn-dependent peptidase ImmA (M78 family)
MTPLRKRTEVCLIAAQETLIIYESLHGTIKPPVPIERIATMLGFQIVPLTLVPDEFSAIVSSRDKLIGINSRHHRHRQRFSIGHELGHIILQHPSESRCTPEQVALYNMEADECAAELLMPTHLLARYLRQGRSTAELRRIFDVSEEALARKMRQIQPPGAAVMEQATQYMVKAEPEELNDRARRLT